MQFNPPHTIHWLVLDIDAPIALDSAGPSVQMLAILDGKVPTPNFLVATPETGHAHAFYALETPVAKGEYASLKALRYAAAIEAALIYGIGADACYANLIAKNPLHTDWRVLEFRKEPYTLNELHDSLDINGPSKSKQRNIAIDSGLRRNCRLFDRLRYYAYQHVEMYREDASFDAWSRHLEDKVGNFNQAFEAPLDYREIRPIARSVARWTWTKYTGLMDDAAFSKKQAYKGARGGRISAKVRSESAISKGETLNSQMSKIRSKGITESQPWKAMGISRAQWYRDQKSMDENSSQT